MQSGVPTVPHSKGAQVAHQRLIISIETETDAQLSHCETKLHERSEGHQLRQLCKQESNELLASLCLKL